jgi:hypothetical protein
MMKELIDRLPADQQTAAAGQILQLLMGATEEMANDARVDGPGCLSRLTVPPRPNLLLLRLASR